MYFPTRSASGFLLAPTRLWTAEFYITGPTVTDSVVSGLGAWVPTENRQGNHFAAFHNHTPPDMNLFVNCWMRTAPDRLYMILSEFRGDLWSLALPE